jgi:hypothetical protein
MNKTAMEQTVRTARRYEAGLALLNNPDYRFVAFECEPTAFYVWKKNVCAYIVFTQTSDCNCEDFKRNNQPCKHIFACIELVKQNAQIEESYDPNTQSGETGEGTDPDYWLD